MCKNVFFYGFSSLTFILGCCIEEFHPKLYVFHQNTTVFFQVPYFIQFHKISIFLKYQFCGHILNYLLLFIFSFEILNSVLFHSEKQARQWHSSPTTAVITKLEPSWKQWLNLIHNVYTCYSDSWLHKPLLHWPNAWWALISNKQPRQREDFTSARNISV